HELAGKLDWRQHFRAKGNLIKNGRNNPESLFVWAENENHIFRRPWLIWGIRSITTVTMILFLLAFFSDIRFLYLAGIMLLIQLVLFMIGLRLSSDAYGVINLHRDGIVTFQKLLAMIEKENFKSGYLAGLTSNLIGTNGNHASKQIDKLSSIADMMNFRYGQLFYFLIDVLFLFDYHCMFALEKWKKQSGKNIRPWITVIGSFEEISSLAIIRYDNPDWCFPQFTDAKQNLAAVNMGHPLLPSDVRVCNNLKIKGIGNVLLITGSNMSGKSTLLRTVGVNLVLAYTGSPVCANDFTCSIMDIYTAMRVNDNLEKKISSFYAELLRIKTIVQAAEKNCSILFLLDEIFKGTNSRDRHIGASVVIKKLSKMGAAGLVSTHDLELGELESDKDFDIENYHFSESYVNNQIVFDYKLRTGVSKTTNALYLMRMVGIDEL
ncbi:MAG: mismatch repair protein MutS domain protein, partial [Firmicutes bacterium]|nr:mismatch repair protein MutS domain protein [Bacillota bacterium]